MLKCNLDITTLTPKTQLGLLDVEKEPYLRVFFSGQVSPKRDSWIVPLQDQNESISVAISANDVPAKIDGNYACIGFAMMCKLQIINERGEYQGYDRYEPIAGAMIPLSKFWKTRFASVELEMIDRTNFGPDVFNRATLRVQITLTEQAGCTLVGTYSDKIRATKMKSLIAFHDALFMRKLLPTRTNCRPMHIKTYFTEISGTKIPACGFAFTAGTSTSLDTGYVEHLVSSAAYIVGMRENEALEIIKTQLAQTTRYDSNFTTLCKIVAMAVCLVSNACDYVSDHSGKRDSERFIHILQTLCGDCEDSGRMAYLFASLILYSDEPNKHKYPWAYCAWHVIRRYVPVIITGIATCPSQDSRKKGKMEDICHIYGNLRPRVAFCREIHANTAQLKLFDSMMKFASWEARLPSLMLEGTNFCNPLVGPLASYYDDSRHVEIFEETLQSVRTTESRNPKLTGLSISSHNMSPRSKTFHEITEEKFSDFYRRPIELWTDVLIRNGVGAAVFSIGYGSQTRGFENDGYGVDFRDWMAMTENLSLIPIIGIDREDYEIMINVLIQEAPTRLEVNPKQANAPDLSRLKSLCYSYPKSEQPTKTTCYFVNHVRKLNDSVLDALESALKSGHFTHIDHLYIPLTEDGELYLILLSVGVS